MLLQHRLSSYLHNEYFYVWYFLFFFATLLQCKNAVKSRRLLPTFKWISFAPLKASSISLQFICIVKHNVKDMYINDESV